jgi:hypothetical protein
MNQAVRILFAVVLCLVATAAFAQPGPPPDPDAPITGIEILIAVGSIFGAKKIFESRKKANP